MKVKTNQSPHLRILPIFARTYTKSRFFIFLEKNKIIYHILDLYTYILEMIIKKHEKISN
jgi:hypothetical protein